MEVLKKTHKKSWFVYFERGSRFEKEILEEHNSADKAILQMTMKGNLYIAEIISKSVLEEEEERYKKKLNKTKELIEDKIKFWKGRSEKIEAERRKRIDNYGRKKETNTLNEEMEHYRQEANINYNVLDVLEKLLKEGFNGD